MTDARGAHAASDKPTFSNPLSIDPDAPSNGAYDNKFHVDRDDMMRYRAYPDPNVRDSKNIDLLNSDITDFQKGQEGAGLQLLKDIDYFQYNAGLDKLITKMEKDGDATVVRDDSGKPTHLVFNGDGNLPKVDLDLKTGDINGESKWDLRKDSADQAKEFFKDKLADGRFGRTSADGTEVDPPSDAGKKSVSDLINAVIDNDPEAIKKLSQDILNNPDLMANVKDALSKLQSSPIAIEQTSDGKPFVTVSIDGGGRTYMKFDAQGGVSEIERDRYYYNGSNDFKEHTPDESPETTLLRASNYALKWADRTLAGTETVLNSDKKLTNDMYKDMPKLIGAYYDDGLSVYF